MHQIDAFNFKMFFLTGEPSILPDFCSLHGEKREGIEEEKGWGGDSRWETAMRQKRKRRTECENGRLRSSHSAWHHFQIDYSCRACVGVSVLMSPAKMRHERGCQRDRQGAATTDLCYTEGIRYNSSLTLELQMHENICTPTCAPARSTQNLRVYKKHTAHLSEGEQLHSRLLKSWRKRSHCKVSVQTREHRQKIQILLKGQCNKKKRHFPFWRYRL